MTDYKFSVFFAIVPIPRPKSIFQLIADDQAKYDLIVAILSGVSAILSANLNKNYALAWFAASICLVSVLKAFDSIRRNLKNKSLHELEGCLSTLYYSVWKSDSSLRITLHLPIDDGQNLIQALNYVSDTPKRCTGKDRVFRAQSGIIGIALRERTSALFVRQNDDYEAYISELIKEFHFTEKDARCTDPATMSYLSVPLISADKEVEAILYCDSTKRDFFDEATVQTIQAGCAGISRFVGRRYSA